MESISLKSLSWKRIFVETHFVESRINNSYTQFFFGSVLLIPQLPLWLVGSPWYVRTLQYCSYLYYRKIHLRRYIHCYYQPMYNNSVIFIMFYLNCHRTFILSQILNLFICGIFKHNLFAADKSIHYLRFLIINNKCRNKVPVIKPINHWKTEHYRESVDRGEGYLDSDLNLLASSNLQK